MTKLTQGALFFLLGGVVMLVGAIRVKQGRTKIAFLPKSPTLLGARDWGYALLPASIGAISSSIGVLLNNRMLAAIGLLGSVLCSFIFMFSKPRWIQPDWLLWLRDHYTPPMVDFMLNQALYDPKKWEWRISTQEGLEAWAAEMAEAYQQRRSHR